MEKYISFFNWHQYGDMYHTRGMLEWISNHIPDDIKLRFYHKRPHRLDLCEKIQSVNIFDANLSWPEFILNTHTGVFGAHMKLPDASTEDLIINTWIASFPKFPREVNSKDSWEYINADTIRNQTSYIVDTINNTYKLNIPHPETAKDVIPTIPTSLPNKEQADKLLNVTSGYRKRILVCNGPVHSEQTIQFDIDAVIKSLVKERTDCAFIYTENISNKEDNEFVIDDYIDRPNLNEVIYLSTFCDILISRMSGPGCAICIDKNFFNSDLSFICLTERESLAHWYKNGTCKYAWTNDYSEESLCSLLKTHIGN